MEIGTDKIFMLNILINYQQTISKWEQVYLFHMFSCFMFTCRQTAHLDVMLIRNRKDQYFRDTSSEISTTSITESPETLISSETVDLISTTVDESSSDENESPIGTYNFIQNWGDQLVPSMKPDGTIVIPGVVSIISDWRIKIDEDLIMVPF